MKIDKNFIPKEFLINSESNFNKDNEFYITSINKIPKKEQKNDTIWLILIFLIILDIL